MFVCQRCRKTLTVDPQLAQAVDTESLAAFQAGQLSDVKALFKGTPRRDSVSTPKKGDSEDGGFLLVEDSTDETRGDSKKTITVGGIDKKESSGGFSFRRKPNQPPPVTQSDPTQNPDGQALSILSQLFQIASQVSEIDHPLCKDCTESYMKELDDETLDVTRQSTFYLMYIRQNTLPATTPDDVEGDLSKLLADEAELERQIAAVRQERAELLALTADQKLQHEKLKRMTEAYWEQFNEFNSQLLDVEEEKNEVTQRLATCTYELEELKRTNILNDAFHIWYEGHFGTINNFRMGRLPSRPITWEEINASWGYAALLLFSVARQLNCTFQSASLIPFGSFTRIEKADAGGTTVYELYGNRDISLGKLFWYRRFDTAMSVFLDLLGELSEFVRRRDPTFQLPHAIQGDKIGSVTFSYSSDEMWTKGLKYMLTNLKWLLLAVDKLLSVCVELHSLSRPDTSEEIK